MSQQVNINLDDETAVILDQMAQEDAYDNRSAWIRRLIRLEHKRREDLRFELTQKGQMQLKLEQEKGVGQPQV